MGNQEDDDSGGISDGQETACGEEREDGGETNGMPETGPRESSLFLG